MSNIYGKYSYDTNKNILFKIVEKEKDGEIEEIFVPIYDGMIEIEETSIDLDEDKELILLKSFMNNNNSYKEISKGLMFGGSAKFAEELNNKRGFRIRPNSNIQKNLQEFLYEQYAGLEADNKIMDVFYTNNMGFYENFSNGYNIKTFVYPNCDISIGDNVFYKREGKYNKVFKHKGSKEEWITNILTAAVLSDNMKIMILGTFASILLEPLEVHENFIIELSGTTGTSKTTALNVCASIFGKPSEYITDWNTTSTAVISKASEINVFPLILDDTKKCKEKEMIPGIVYSFSGGKDRARANTDGSLQEQKTFKNIGLLTGEVPLADYLKGGETGSGVFARFISLDGGAFEKSENNKMIADQLNADTKKYYGTIGYEFICWLNTVLEDEEELDNLKEIYKTHIMANSAKVTKEISKRRSNHIALLQTTGYLLDKFLGTDYMGIENLINKLLIDTDQSVEDTDNVKNAYYAIMEYCNKNEKRFYRKGDEVEAIGSPLGQFKDNQYQFFSKDDVDKIISPFGDVTDLLRNFKERDYLVANKGEKKYSKSLRKIYGDKKTTRFYVIDKKFYDEDVNNGYDIRDDLEPVQGNFEDI